MVVSTMLKPKRNLEFETRLLPDGYVLVYSEQSSLVHTLTPLGGLVWEFCDGESSAEEIADTISSIAKVPASQDEVMQLVKELQVKGLLVSS